MADVAVVVGSCGRCVGTDTSLRARDDYSMWLCPRLAMEVVSEASTHVDGTISS